MAVFLQDNGLRRTVLSGVQRVVVKVGSKLLREAPEERCRALVGELMALRGQGMEVILVTSGAIPLGMTILGRKRRPADLARIQALSALGQGYLMRHYENACEAFGAHCAQLLLTAADLRDRERNVRVAGCIRALLDEGVLPIINENDSVCVDQIKIGDNDTLAAMVATMMNADLTVLLTTVDAFHKTLEDGSYGERFSVVTSLDEGILSMAGNTDGNPYSTGGMITKLHAASICIGGGHAMGIVEGWDFGNLRRFMAGEDIGTLFCQGVSRNRMHSWQRFLAFFSEPMGSLVVDEGAVKALVQENRSLLPGGVLGVSGVFRKGDPVQILDGHRCEIARGIANFSSDELLRICGAKSSQLAELLGHAVDSPEAVHKDYLVLR